jgi:hypothetical protein
LAPGAFSCVGESMKSINKDVNIIIHLCKAGECFLEVVRLPLP